MYCSCSVGLRSLTGDAYHEFVTPHSRFGAVRAAASPARGAKQAPAIPAARNRLYRIAKDLSHIKKFDHGSVRRPQADKWAGMSVREVRRDRISHAVFSWLPRQ